MSELINPTIIGNATLHNGNNVDVVKSFNDCCIDLTVTSPPYDNLRNYLGYDFNFEVLANELFRITKDGGVVVWVVGDATINGSESGSSFKQAIYFMSIGFKLHDTMIYEKNSSSFPANRNGNRYTNIFEYMFVFVKGEIKVANLIIDKKNKWAGHTNWGDNTQYDKDGNLVKTNNIKPIPDFSPRNNIWKYTVGFNDKTGHPAVFPEDLARDHILSWSNEGDVVFDCFLGSGTTGKIALLNNRKFVGIEIAKDYFNKSIERIKQTTSQGNLFAPSLPAIKPVQDSLIS